MTTYLFTSPATDTQTGRRGVLVLTDKDAAGPAGGGSTLVLADDPEEIRFWGANGGKGLRRADVESVEITADLPADSGVDTSRQTSIVVVRMRDGSAAGYALARSNPGIVRKVFMEAGWTRPTRSEGSTTALAKTA